MSKAKKGTSRKPFRKVDSIQYKCPECDALYLELELTQSTITPPADLLCKIYGQCPDNNCEHIGCLDGEDPEPVNQPSNARPLFRPKNRNN